MTNFKIGLLGVLISAKLILVYSWTNAKDFQVWYGQYPNSTTSYPSIGNCYNCDYMRCIMSCTNDNGCTAMGYDTSAQSCYFLVGRLVSASYLKPSSYLNYYEKKYNDGFINLFRGGFYMIGFSYTAMSRMYVLQSFSNANNFSVVSRGGYFTEKYIRNGNQLTSLTNITSLLSCQTKCQSHWNCAHLIYESSTSTCVLKDFSKEILSNCSSSDTCQSVTSNVIATPYQFYIGGFNTSFYYDYRFAFLETDGMTWSDLYYYYGL